MISEWFAAALLVGLGVLFDQTVWVIIRSRQSVAGMVLMLGIVNFVFMMAMIAVAYFVDGFIVHGVLPDGMHNVGLLRWQLVVICVVSGYLWIGVASFWRFVTEEK